MTSSPLLLIRREEIEKRLSELFRYTPIISEAPKSWLKSVSLSLVTLIIITPFGIINDWQVTITFHFKMKYWTHETCVGHAPLDLQSAMDLFPIKYIDAWIGWQTTMWSERIRTEVHTVGVQRSHIISPVQFPFITDNNEQKVDFKRHTSVHPLNLFKYVSWIFVVVLHFRNVEKQTRLLIWLANPIHIRILISHWEISSGQWSSRSQC